MATQHSPPLFHLPFSRSPSPSPSCSESSTPRDITPRDTTSSDSLIIDTPLADVNAAAGMYPEILIASAWWTEALRNGAIGLNYLPLIGSPSKYSLFYQSLSWILYDRYSSHWYPCEPSRGSGYRSISYDNRFDRLLKLAGERINLKEKESMILFAHCRFWIMKINPGSVKIVKGDAGGQKNADGVITGNTFIPPTLLYYSNNNTISNNANNSSPNNSSNNSPNNSPTNSPSSSSSLSSPLASLPPLPPSSSSSSSSASSSTPRFPNHHVKLQQELKEKEKEASTNGAGQVRGKGHKQTASLSNDVVLNHHHHHHHTNSSTSLPPHAPRHHHNNSMNNLAHSVPPPAHHHHHHSNSNHHLPMPKYHHYKTNSSNNVMGNHSLPPLPNPVITVAPIAEYKRLRAARNTKKFMSQPFIEPNDHHSLINEHHQQPNNSIININIITNTPTNASYYSDSSDGSDSDSASPTSASSSSASSTSPSNNSSPTLSPISLFHSSQTNSAMEFSLENSDSFNHSPPASSTNHHHHPSKVFPGYLFSNIQEEKSDHHDKDHIKELFYSNLNSPSPSPPTTPPAINHLWGAFGSPFSSNAFASSIFAQPIDGGA